MAQPYRHARPVPGPVVLLALALAPGGIAMVAPEPPPFYADTLNLMLYPDAAGKEHRVTDAAAWAKRREHILANMQRVIGPLPDAGLGGPLDARVEEEVRLPGVTRRKITFAGGDGDRVPAYLLLPNERKEKAPAMPCLRQTIPVGKGSRPASGAAPPHTARWNWRSGAVSPSRPTTPTSAT